MNTLQLFHNAYCKDMAENTPLHTIPLHAVADRVSRRLSQAHLFVPADMQQRISHAGNTPKQPDDCVVATFGGAFACKPVSGSCASVRALYD